MQAGPSVRRAYGFRRNMLGVRWIGLVSALLSAIWLAFDGAAPLPATPTDLMGQFSALPSAHRVGLLASAVAVVLWTLGVSEGRVRAAAFSYAERLVRLAMCSPVSRLQAEPQGQACQFRSPTAQLRGSSAANRVQLGGLGARAASAYRRPLWAGLRSDHPPRQPR